MARKANGERKTRLVTQLDEDAVCRSIGYTACKVRFACDVRYYKCCLRVVGTETAGCLWSSEDTAFSCLRAAPLLRGLVVKSGHKHVFPPSFHLPLHSPLSFCLLAPSFFTSLLQPTSLLLFLLRQIPPFTFFLHAAKCKSLNICQRPSPL